MLRRNNFPTKKGETVHAKWVQLLPFETFESSQLKRFTLKTLDENKARKRKVEEKTERRKPYNVGKKCPLKVFLLDDIPLAIYYEPLTGVWEALWGNSRLCLIHRGVDLIYDNDLRREDPLRCRNIEYTHRIDIMGKPKYGKINHNPVGDDRFLYHVQPGVYVAFRVRQVNQEQDAPFYHFADRIMLESAKIQQDPKVIIPGFEFFSCLVMAMEMTYRKDDYEVMIKEAWHFKTDYNQIHGRSEARAETLMDQIAKKGEYRTMTVWPEVPLETIQRSPSMHFKDIVTFNLYVARLAGPQKITCVFGGLQEILGRATKRETASATEFRTMIKLCTEKTQTKLETNPKFRQGVFEVMIPTIEMPADLQFDRVEPPTGDQVLRLSKYYRRFEIELERSIEEFNNIYCDRSGQIHYKDRKPQHHQLAYRKYHVDRRSADLYLALETRYGNEKFSNCGMPDEWNVELDKLEYCQMSNFGKGQDIFGNICQPYENGQTTYNLPKWKKHQGIMFQANRGGKDSEEKKKESPFNALNQVLHKEENVEELRGRFSRMPTGFRRGALDDWDDEVPTGYVRWEDGRGLDYSFARHPYYQYNGE